MSVKLVIFLQAKILLCLSVYTDFLKKATIQKISNLNLNGNSDTV